MAQRKYKIHLQSKVPNEAYKDGWDRIFNKSKVPVYCRSCKQELDKCMCRDMGESH